MGRGAQAGRTHPLTVAVPHPRFHAHGLNAHGPRAESPVARRPFTRRRRRPATGHGHSAAQETRIRPSALGTHAGSSRSATGALFTQPPNTGSRRKGGTRGDSIRRPAGRQASSAGAHQVRRGATSRSPVQSPREVDELEPERSAPPPPPPAPRPLGGRGRSVATDRPPERNSISAHELHSRRASDPPSNECPGQPPGHSSAPGQPAGRPLTTGSRVS